MARRKRLTLTPEAGGPPPAPDTPPSRASTHATGLAPPIARVAAEASASAALDEMTQAWTQAREGGRLIQALALDSIDEGWLIRDRLAAEDEQIADLVGSIRDRGQQVPIEVVALPQGRFGLISGWRRLRALRALHGETAEDRFATVLAILRQPAGPAEAYRAMVEENEIRANLSYYERARIALRAAQAGAFADARAAIAALFAAGSPAKRSKIASFLTLVQGLDDRLRFAWTIPERLGLDLARALAADPDLLARLRERLRKGAPADAAAELALLTRALAPAPGAPVPQPPTAAEAAPRTGAGPRADALAEGALAEDIRPGLRLQTVAGARGTRLVLSGPGVDAALRARLIAWLRDA